MTIAGMCLPLWIAGVAVAQQGPLPEDANPALQTDQVGVVPSFEIVIDEEKLTVTEPLSGTLTLYFIDNARSGLGRGMKPANGPFWDNLQPMYSVTVRDFKPGDVITVGPDALGYPGPLNTLEEGVYRVQAVLDCTAEGSDWLVERGNLFSDAWNAYLPGEDGVIAREVLQALDREITFPQRIPLERRSGPRNYAPLDDLSFETVPSAILSEAAGAPVSLKAGILAPTIRRSNREYPVLYQIPAFGDDYTMAWEMSRLRTQMPGFNTKLNRAVYRVIIGVDGPWGHSLLANSDLNGPVLDAVVNELIPAIEKKYPVIAEPEARILWGASSGGWAAIWAMLHRPDAFGAAWAVCPDPVDFRAFQRTNIYEDDNFYVDASGSEIPSFVKNGQTVITVRTENLIEELMGAGGDSAQQWDSWNAIFGKPADGRPVPLFDWKSGDINRAVAEHWARYDIGRLLAAQPDTYGPIFRDRIRIIVGENDNYFLDDAVKLLRDRLAETGYLSTEEDDAFGSIRIIEDEDHFTLQDYKWRGEIGQEIYTYIEEADVKDRKRNADDGDDAGN